MVVMIERHVFAQHLAQRESVDFIFGLYEATILGTGITLGYVAIRGSPAAV